MISIQELTLFCDLVYLNREEAEFFDKKYGSRFCLDKRFIYSDSVHFKLDSIVNLNLKKVTSHLIIPKVYQFRILGSEVTFSTRKNFKHQSKFYFYCSFFSGEKNYKHGFGHLSKRESKFADKKVGIWEFSLFDVLNLLTINDNNFIIHHPLKDIKFPFGWKNYDISKTTA